MKARKKVLIVYIIYFLISCLHIVVWFRTRGEVNIGLAIRSVFVNFFIGFSKGTIALIVLIVFKNITIEQLQKDL